MTKLALTAIAAAFVATLATVPAQADDIRVAVNYGDLDITSAAGASALANRIQANVAQACVRSSDIRDLHTVALCRDSLTADAVAQLNGKGATLVADELSPRG